MGADRAVVGSFRYGCDGCNLTFTNKTIRRWIIWWNGTTHVRSYRCAQCFKEAVSVL